MILRVIKMTFATLAVICYIAIFGLLSIISPSVFGYRPVVVLTGSMEPSIKTGSIIYNYEISDFSDIAQGDVITFKTSAEAPLVTHRVMLIDEEEQTFRTKGDNNSVLDAMAVPYEQVVAKVAPFYLPKVGFYMVYAQNPKVIGVIAGIIVMNVVLGYFGKDEEDEEEEEETRVAKK